MLALAAVYAPALNKVVIAELFKLTEIVENVVQFINKAIHIYGNNEEQFVFFVVFAYPGSVTFGIEVQCE